MKKKPKVILIALAALVIIVIFAVRAAMGNVEANLEQLSEQPLEEINLAGVADGLYRGSYTAFPVAVEVEVNVNEQVITAIELLKHQNGQGGAAEVILDDVIVAQSLEVDTVSGATYSSMFILKAVED
ncbi:MAG TPA: FMN-binding protein, partial [Firmicutes bacterium]|nr:FMN-binding protein [Bacillota bacterium]